MDNNSVCRFCDISIDKTNPKSNNLTQQLLQYHYIDEFYFYFSKPINEILSHNRSIEYTMYRDMLYDINRSNLSFSFYTRKDSINVIYNKSKYNTHHKPMIIDDACHTIINKNMMKKVHIDRRHNDEREDINRYNKKKQQLPLRQEDILSNNIGFVNNEEYDSKVYDIYNPSFSSYIHTPNDHTSNNIVNMKNILYDKVSHINNRITIPLLCIKDKQKTPFIRSDFSHTSDHVRYKNTNNNYINKINGNSDNQSTQFSITYNNRSIKNRRKQVLEDSKRSGTTVSYTSRTFNKYTSSPKVFKKKKQEASIKCEKKTNNTHKKSHNNIDPSMKSKGLTSNAIFNTKSWKLIKSWDNIVQRSIDSKYGTKDKRYKDIDNILDVRHIHTSNDKYNKYVGSPRIPTTDRHSNNTHNIPYASFRDKYVNNTMKDSSNKICMMKKLHRPIWINNIKNDSKEKKKGKSISKSKEVKSSRTKEDIYRSLHRDNNNILNRDKLVLMDRMSNKIHSNKRSDSNDGKVKLKKKSKSKSKKKEKKEGDDMYRTHRDNKGYILQYIK